MLPWPLQAGVCPYIARNLTLTALRHDSLWTAVDAWFDSHPLAEDLARGPLPPTQVASVLGDVLRGVAALHQQKIVAREIHVEQILIRKDGGRAVLTDLELAKLLEVEGTVSAEWRRNPYRAPEVAGGESHPQADVYSCARLLVHLMSGSLPDYPDDTEWLRSRFAGNPGLATFVSALSPIWHARPSKISQLLRALSQMEMLHDRAS